MTVATSAFYIMRPQLVGCLADTPPPLIMWGYGTPAGTIEPWLNAPKGSFWIQSNAEDDVGCIWLKCRNNGAEADWYKLPLTVLATASVLNTTAEGGTAAYFH